MEMALFRILEGVNFFSFFLFIRIGSIVPRNNELVVKRNQPYASALELIRSPSKHGGTFLDHVPRVSPNLPPFKAKRVHNIDAKVSVFGHIQPSVASRGVGNSLWGNHDETFQLIGRQQRAFFELIIV